MLNENIRSYFVKYILYAGRESTSMNSLTSGRSDEWKAFFSYCEDNWLFGMGATKRESLILTALLVFGVVGGVPVLLMSVYPLIWGLRRLKGDEEYMTFTSIAMVYWVNSFFEQQAPFGPGAKCYLLWLMFGILSVQRKECNR